MAADSTLKPIRLMLLDRDGVINVDSPDYIKSAAEWRPIPGALAAIAELNAAGIHTALCSNQAGIGRQRLTARDLAGIHVRFETLLKEHSGHIDLWRFCPHLPQARCGCRKPASGMLDDCLTEFAVSADSCAFVGDSITDMQAAVAAGCLPIFVDGQQQYNEQRQGDLRALGVTLIFEDLRAATMHILAHNNECADSGQL